MENLNKTVRGNAVISYFLIGISLLFLVNKEKNVGHPFVKSHVKSAFILHVLMGLTIFIMSYGMGEGIKIMTYSLNFIITAGVCLMIFAGMLYGASKAHKGKTLSIAELLHIASKHKQYISKNESQSIKESDGSIILLSQIPFIGYIIGVRNLDLPHIKDILQLNFITTITAALFFIFGYGSLASLIMLAYIIWSVMQSMTLFHEGKIMSFSIDLIPTVEEKYILQKSALTHLKNTLLKKEFISFGEIKKQKTLQRQQDELESAKNMKSSNTYLLRNIAILAILFVISIYFFEWNSRIQVLFLFPLTYLIGYHDTRKAYKMPYIYDIYALISGCSYRLTHIFSQAKQLKNTTKTQSIKIGETKKES